MNNKRLYFVLLFALINTNGFLFGSLGPLGKFFNIDQLAQGKTFATQIEEEIQGLNKIKSDVEERCSDYKSRFERVQKALDFLKSKVKDASEVEKDFINKNVLVFNQTIQVLTEIAQSCEQVVSILNSNVRLLEEYRDDPEFTLKDLKIRHKSVYSLEDLQNVSDLFFLYENKIKENEERLKKISSDLDQRVKTLNLAKQEFEDKKKEQKELRASGLDSSSDQSLSFSQQAQILDEEKALLKYKKDLAELKVIELEQKKQLVSNEAKTNKIKYKIVEESYYRVIKDLFVDKKDLKKSEDILKQQMLITTKKQEECKKKLEAIDALRAEELASINQLRQNCKVSDSEIEAIKDWTFQPSTIEGWDCLISIAKLANHVTYGLDISKEDLQAQIDAEKAKLADVEVNNLIKNSWFKLTNSSFGTLGKDDFAKEIKNYEKAKIDLQNHISTTNDQQVLVSNALNLNNAMAGNIKNRMKELRLQKETVFKSYSNEYANYLSKLKHEIYEETIKRGESISQLSDAYNSINNTRNLTIKKIDAIIDELKIRSQGIKGSVFVKILKNFIPDLRKFVNYISDRSLFQSLNNAKNKLSDFLYHHMDNGYNFLSLLLQIILLFTLFLLAKTYFINIVKFLRAISPKYGIGYNLVNFLTATVMFVGKHLLAFVLWGLCLVAVKYRFIFDGYLSILFYLFSIPFLIFMISMYVKYLQNYNVENGYLLVNIKYQKRFFNILRISLIFSVVLMLFREAFLLANIPKSDLPLLLLALNFVILQISALFILNKNQVLNALPKSGSFWEWVSGQLDKYYYLIISTLVVLVIIGNPYLGYGPQLFSAISKIILIGLLIPFFLFLHEKLKKVSTSLFFQSEGDVTKERFDYARTAYGIFIIVSFALLLFLGIVIAANIWGYHIGFDEIKEWLHYEIRSYTAESGKKISVDILDFAMVIVYLLGGIVFAYLVNRFILARIFDLLMVNVGIQNAIASLVRYLIIIISLVMGLRSIGLGSLITYILVIVGGLGVAGKEIVTDILGYFIILVQRPIKIGDFIRLDNDVTGVVRNINLRSVVLRRKNSVTVIVPNSQITSRPIVNWNYSRSYFALEDIMISVPYNADPEKVKTLLLSVLGSNIYILKNPAPIVWLWDFVENGFQFLVRGYVGFDKVLDQWQISSEIRLELVKVLRAEGIEVNSPVKVVKFAPGTNNIGG